MYVATDHRAYSRVTAEIAEITEMNRKYLLGPKYGSAPADNERRFQRLRNCRWVKKPDWLEKALKRGRFSWPYIFLQDVRFTLAPEAAVLIKGMTFHRAVSAAGGSPKDNYHQNDQSHRRDHQYCDALRFSESPLHNGSSVTRDWKTRNEMSFGNRTFFAF
jgi:hypothetical protein